MNKFKSIQQNRQQPGLKAYCPNIYTLHKGQIPRGKECVKKQAENWLIPINGHLVDSNDLLKENLLVYEPEKRSKVRINLFVTLKKNETMNSPIHEFKVLQKGQRAF